MFDAASQAMSRNTLAFAWLAIALLVGLTIFLLEDGLSKIRMSNTGVQVIGTVAVVDRAPADSRSYHIVSYELASQNYRSRMAGAAGYAVGDKVPLVLDPAAPAVPVEGFRESILRELIGFCLGGAAFVASMMTIYLAWRFRG
jgi:hypothetical protein